MNGQTETAQQTIERLTAELAAKNTELAAKNKTIEGFNAQATQLSADEVIIQEKMSHGLTRSQAIAVIRRQRAHDEMENSAGVATNQPK